MRRFKQELDEKSVKDILHRNNHGVLSMCIGSVPYGVPMSYAYDGGDIIYFHSAVVGTKIDILRENNNVSFCVVDMDDVYPEKYSTRYASVIATGKIEAVDSKSSQYMTGLEEVKKKYVPDDSFENFEKIVEKDEGRVVVLVMKITQMHGKHGAFNDK